MVKFIHGKSSNYIKKSVYTYAYGVLTPECELHVERGHVSPYGTGHGFKYIVRGAVWLESDLLTSPLGDE